MFRTGLHTNPQNFSCLSLFHFPLKLIEREMSHLNTREVLRKSETEMMLWPLLKSSGCGSCQFSLKLFVTTLSTETDSTYKLIQKQGVGLTCYTWKWEMKPCLNQNFHIQKGPETEREKRGWLILSSTREKTEGFQKVCVKARGEGRRRVWNQHMLAGIMLMMKGRPSTRGPRFKYRNRCFSKLKGNSSVLHMFTLRIIYRAIITLGVFFKLHYCPPPRQPDLVNYS